MSQYHMSVSKNGRVTLPPELLAELGLAAGDVIRAKAVDGVVTFQRKAPLKEILESIPTPAHLIGRDIDEMIEEATEAHAEEVIQRMRLGLE